MIELLEGVIQAIHEQSITLSVLGIGFTVQLPETSTLRLKETTTLYTYLHWNQEQGPSLFGFLTEEDRSVFLLIISCQGIGPKLGLAVLKQLSAASFIAALVTNDIKTLSSVSGIGSRKAEHLIVTLKTKAAHLVEKGFDVGAHGVFARTLLDVSSALEGLGYERYEITKALNFLKEQGLPSDSSTAFVLKKTLSYLAQK